MEQNNSAQEHLTVNPKDITESLNHVNSLLAQCLAILNSLGPTLSQTLHDDQHLPKMEEVHLAARATDTLHKIQLLLDPPALILADHFLGYVRSKCLSAAVQHGVSDALEKGPMALSDLAKSTHSRSDRLRQILGILCNRGVFTYDDVSGRYSNSAASSLIASKHWTQWHNWVTLYGNQFYDIARGIPASVDQDASRTAAQLNYNTNEDMFTFFRTQEWAPQLHRTLGSGAVAQLPGILEDYPWHELSSRLVMDIGGGGGDFIAGLLRRHPTMQGGLFDQPHIADTFREAVSLGGKFHALARQIRTHHIVGGDFFKSVPRCSDYTMKWCLHDWKDSEAVVILKNIRKSLVPEPGSRLVVLESVLSDRHSGRLAQYGDINMMMTIGGQERTENDWRRLARLSGWHVHGIWDLRRAWVKALDFRPLEAEF